MTYNKLVRDKIPEIILASGKELVTRISGEEEYKQLLKDKLVEEVKEFLDSDNAEELADILEVLMALSSSKGIDWKEIEKTAMEKRDERGGFEERVVLLEVK